MDDAFYHVQGRSSGSKDAKVDDSGQYEVIEELLDKRALLGGDTIYLCRWKGMEPSQDTCALLHDFI